MTLVGGVALPRRVSDRVEEFLWRHPEWVACVGVAGAWVLLLAQRQGVTAHAMPGMPGMQMPHAGVMRADLASQSVMVVAMMVPTAIPMTRYVAFNSLRHRRGRAIAWFLAAYAAVWVAFGMIVAEIAVRVTRTRALAHVHRNIVLAVLLAVAAGYELTAAKRRALRACHRTIPIPPRGWRADAASARLGWRHARACVAGCWALMLVASLAGHHVLPIMVLVTVIVVAQKWLVIGTKVGLPVALALACVGTGLLV